MDSDSVFGASGLIMENGINSSLNPFYSNTQDYDVKTHHEETSLPNVTGQSNGIHHSTLFSDFNVDSAPFSAPDWVVFPPAGFYEDNTPDVFQTTSGIWGEETDIFQPYKDKVDTDLTQSSSTNQNTECSSSANQSDPLLDFILSRQKKSQDTPSFTPAFDSPDVFQETSSFFSNADPVSDDIFKTNVSDLKAFDPLFDSQNDVPSDQKSNDDLLLIGPETRLDVRMSPVGLQNGAVQEIPSNGGLMFRRPPPKPAPRSKAHKSVPQPQNTTAEVENDLPVYEDVLLIGQERCVEDWPEHSAELSPEWKPAGKLRLRRDSVLITEASDGVDGTAKKNGKQTLGKKLRHSLTIRRSSKDKIVDEVKSSETNTNTLRRGSKLVVDGTDEFFTLEEEAQNEAVEFKSKKSSKPKIITHRRGSKDKIVDEVKSSETNTNTLRRGSKLVVDGTDEFFTLEEEAQNEAVEFKSKKSSKLKIITHRRGSKDKIVDEVKSSETNTNTLRRGSKLVVDGTDEFFTLEEEAQNEAVEFKSKKSSKLKIITHRRGSKAKHTFPADYQDDLTSSSKTADLTAFGQQKDEDLDFKPIPEIDDERNTGGKDDGQKRKKKVKVKFVPQRGFVIGLSRADNEPPEGTPHFKENEDELKGACGFTPHQHLKDHDGMDDLKGTSVHTEDTSLRTGAGRSYSPNHFKSSYSNEFMGPSWDSKAFDHFTNSDFSDRHQETHDCRPKKPTRFKVPRLHRRQSKSVEEPEIWPTKDHDEMKKPPILQVPPLSRRDSKAVEEDEVPQKGADLFRAGDLELEDDWEWEEYTPDNKPQKPKETDTHRRGSKDAFPKDVLESPGAMSGNDYLSDAAKAEWMSAQMDIKRLRDQEEDRKREEEEDEGDTDSLMEWWNTVEFWDEETLNERISSKEEETISFKAVADKVHRGLRVYLKLFMERAEFLYQHVLILYGIADDLSNFHHRAKIANITGGTTTAVGGAMAIAGLALVPVTLGTSIIISAIGLGVATAGGITAASATISDNVNNMHDRKKIEVIVQDYGEQLVEMQRCLRFIIEGLGRLRANPLLRRNNYYTGDWEVRRALQTISLVTDPVERAEEIIHNTLAKLASLHSGMDKYFTKDMEVKKGCKKEVTAEVRSLAKQLQEGLVELNSIREQLLDATGNI